MIKELFCPGLLDTGPVNDRLMVGRDGIVNFYVLKAPDSLVCIDTGWRPARVSRCFDLLGLNTRDVGTVLVTHLHWDHARCLDLFRDAEILAGEHEVPSLLVRRPAERRPPRRLRDEQVLTIAGLEVRVVETPGHTSGSVSYLVDGHLLFCGDLLRLKRGKVVPFPAWLGRDAGTLRQSIGKLAGMKGIEYLLTAHSGTTDDVEYAFSEWCGAGNDLPAGSDRS